MEYESLESHIDCQLADLPEAIRTAMTSALKMFWDGLLPDGRRTQAQQHDFENNPAMQPERMYWHNLNGVIYETELALTKWEKTNDGGTPSEALIRETKLAALSDRLANLKRLYKMPPFLVLDWNALTDVALAKVVAINIATEDEADKQEQLDQWQQRTAFDESIYNGTVIRWRYWVEQMPQLSAAEAARLMSALDPDLFKSLDHRPNKNDPTKRCEKAAMIQRLAERQDMQVATPTEWLAWAIQEQIKVHDGFRLAVESLTAPVVSAGDSYTLADAAQAIAAQQGWHDGARDTLKKQMMQAASDGTLTVRNPHTDLPYKPGTGRDFYELVTPADVNAWLEKQGAPYRWNVAAPAKDTAKPAPMVTARDAPAPLTEGDGRAPSTIPNGPRFSMTKAGLIEAHEHEWPTIKGDIAGAATNGLKAAKAGSRGWYEDIAMEWARAKGRRTTNIETTASLSGAMNRMATLPSSKHLEER